MRPPEDCDQDWGLGTGGLRTADYQLPTVDWRLLDADWPTAVRHVGVEWANCGPPVVSAECSVLEMRSTYAWVKTRMEFSLLTETLSKSSCNLPNNMVIQLELSLAEGEHKD